MRILCLCNWVVLGVFFYIENGDGRITDLCLCIYDSANTSDYHSHDDWSGWGSSIMKFIWGVYASLMAWWVSVWIHPCVISCVQSCEKNNLDFFFLSIVFVLIKSCWPSLQEWGEEDAVVSPWLDGLVIYFSRSLALIMYIYNIIIIIIIIIIICTYVHYIAKSIGSPPSNEQVWLL